MHKLDLVRGQGNDTNGSNINGDNTDCDNITGAKVSRNTERGG